MRERDVVTKVTDDVSFYHDMPMKDHEAEITQADKWLQAANGVARAERALRLPGATARTVAERAVNWAEIRPE